MKFLLGLLIPFAAVMLLMKVSGYKPAPDPCITWADSVWPRYVAQLEPFDDDFCRGRVTDFYRDAFRDKCSSVPVPNCRALRDIETYCPEHDWPEDMRQKTVRAACRMD